MHLSIPVPQRGMRGSLDGGGGATLSLRPLHSIPKGMVLPSLLHWAPPTPK